MFTFHHSNQINTFLESAIIQTQYSSSQTKQISLEFSIYSLTYTKFENTNSIQILISNIYILFHGRREAKISMCSKYFIPVAEMWCKISVGFLMVYIMLAWSSVDAKWYQT